MTRREYLPPTHLSGGQLAVELKAQSLEPLDVQLNGDVLVVLWDRDLSPAEIAQADAVVAAHDWTEAKELQARRAKVKELAAAMAGSLDDPMAVIARNGNRATYQAVTALWVKFNQLIDHLNGQRPLPTKLPAPRTWKQVLDAGRGLAQSETDPEA